MCLTARPIIYVDPPRQEGRGCSTRTAKVCLDKLIDELLQLSWVTHQKLNRTEVDISALAATVFGEVQDAADARNVRFQVEDGLRASADPHLLRIALENLIDNAWKFTRRVAHADIEVGRMGENGSTVFYVRDNGAGFDMADAERLFGPFQRLHVRDEFEGNGMGLVTVQRIIHLHGGRIWASAARDNGATFFFTLAPAHQ